MDLNHGFRVMSPRDILSSLPRFLGLVCQCIVLNPNFLALGFVFVNCAAFLARDICLGYAGLCIHHEVHYEGGGIGIPAFALYLRQDVLYLHFSLALILFGPLAKSFMQHFLYFLPEPHGQGHFFLGFLFSWGVSTL